MLCSIKSIRLNNPSQFTKVLPPLHRTPITITSLRRSSTIIFKSWEIGFLLSWKITLRKHWGVFEVFILCIGIIWLFAVYCRGYTLRVQHLHSNSSVIGFVTCDIVKLGGRLLWDYGFTWDRGVTNWFIRHPSIEISGHFFDEIRLHVWSKVEMGFPLIPWRSIFDTIFLFRTSHALLNIAGWERIWWNRFSWEGSLGLGSEDTWFIYTEGNYSRGLEDKDLGMETWRLESLPLWMFCIFEYLFIKFKIIL